MVKHTQHIMLQQSATSHLSTPLLALIEKIGKKCACEQKLTMQTLEDRVPPVERSPGSEQVVDIP